MRAIWCFENDSKEDAISFGKQIEKLGCFDLARLVYEEHIPVQNNEKPEEHERKIKRLERLGIDVPLQVFTLGPLPEPNKKPTRPELPIIGRCMFCSGDLVSEGRFALCLDCGKWEDANLREDKDRKRRLRKDLRKLRM